MLEQSCHRAGEAAGLTRRLSFPCRTLRRTFRRVSPALGVAVLLLAAPVSLRAAGLDDLGEEFASLQQHRVQAELDLVTDIEAKLLSGKSLDKLDTPAYWQRLGEVETMLSALSTPEARERIRALGREHSDPNVRRMVLWVVERHLPDPEAQKLLFEGIHDPDDLVSFAGIRLTGQHDLEAGLEDLFDVVGVASGTIHSPGKPVGVGAALGNRSVFLVLGTEKYQEIFRRERLWQDKGVLRLPVPAAEAGLPEPYPTAKFEFFSGRWEQEQFDWYRRLRHELPGSATEVAGGVHANQVPDARGIPMVEVPAGPFEYGLDESRLPSRRFVTHDYNQPRQVELDGFLIDVFPVTNEYYDRFVAEVAANGHGSCHPDEKSDKVHRRNTWRDPRMKPRNPVSGIDWYDAWAFCNWLGKQLPTEQQWEKAARGTDGRLYPWGNTWDPRRVTYAETLWGHGIPTIDIWRAHLYDVTDYPEPYPSRLTEPVDAHPGNVSPYGVRELIGNVWEWTRTNYFTGEDMDPHFREMHPTEYTHDADAFASIRGGAWSSIHEILVAPYRSKDLFSDRHNEIGFRCVQQSK